MQRESSVLSCHRFIQRHIQEQNSQLDPQTVFSFLADPLRNVLTGKFFTALLSKPRSLSTDAAIRRGNFRITATHFSLLGPLHFTVLDILQQQFSMGRPWQSSPSYSSAGVKVPELTPIDTSVKCSGLGLTCTETSGSVLSFATQGREGDTVHLSLHTFCPSLSSQNSTSRSGGCNTSPTNVAPAPSELRHYYPTLSPAALAGCVSGVVSAEGKVCLSKTDGEVENGDCWCGDSVSGESGEGVTVCGDILNELMATWSGEELQNESKPQQYEEIEFTYTDFLPDSESFLQEFQCAFDQSAEGLTAAVVPSYDLSSPSLLLLSTEATRSRLLGRKSLSRSLVLEKSSVSTASCEGTLSALQSTPSLLQYTPELFTHSFVDISHSGSESSDKLLSSTNDNSGSVSVRSEGTVMSPELFSSPKSCNTSTAVLASLSSSGERQTPVIGGHFRSTPKRKLLHPLRSSLQTPTVFCTPLSQVSDDSSTSCFSPELFP